MKIEDLEERIAPISVLANVHADNVALGQADHSGLGHAAIHATEGTAAESVIAGISRDA